MFSLKGFALLALFVYAADAGYVKYPYGGATSYVNVEKPVYGGEVPVYAQYNAYAAYPKYGQAYGYDSGKDYYSYPKYQYAYGVHDPHTGDYKTQEEIRDGDVVKGSYTVADPDGTLRVVHYTADDHNGFNAVVTKQGHAVHPAPVVYEKEYLVPKPYAAEPLYGAY